MTEEARADRATRPLAATRRRGRRLALWAAALLLLLCAALAAGVGWAVRSERGSAWLLRALPGVEVDAPRGHLLGDFSAQRLLLRLPGGTDSVVLGGLAWRGLAIERAGSPLWLRVRIESLTAERVDLVFAPSQNRDPMPAPTDLALPIELDLRALRIGALHAAALGEQPLRQLTARLHLGANGGAEHRIDDLALGWDRLRASASARVGSAAPMPLRLELALVQQAAVPSAVPGAASSAAAGAAPATAPAWRAQVTLDGPLAAPRLQASLRAAALRTGSRAGAAPEQTLDARATLRPFAAWPLGDLQASTQALDLSALASGAPVTALTLQAVATSSAADQPASVAIVMNNPLAGRWNEARLPLHALTLELAARPDQPSELTLRTLDARLGTPRAQAGRITGQGRWSPTGWELATTWADVQPAQLDARAPAMRLGGPVTLGGGASADAPVNVLARLAGSIVDRGTPRPVQLELDATAQAQRLELRHLQAAAGGARATLAGLAVRSGDAAPWSLKARGTLVDFDPSVWWPGAADSAWRRGVHRLNAEGEVDVIVPTAGAGAGAGSGAGTGAGANANANANAVAGTGPGTAWVQSLAAVRGTAAFALARSVLAGVPLSGRAALRGDGRGPVQATLQLDAAGNALRAEGRVAVAGNGSTDAWDLAVDSAALGRLEPLYRLLAPPGSETTLAGTLNAKAHLDGRWPAVSTRGELDAAGLRAGALSVERAQARWTLGTAAAAPAEAQVTLSQLRLAQDGPQLRLAQDATQLRLAPDAPQARLVQRGTPGPSLDTLQLQLAGTGRAHTLGLRAETRGRPPAWIESMQGGAAIVPPGPAAAASAAAVGPVTPSPAPRTVATLQARGGVVELDGAPFAGWRGTVAQFEVRSDAPGAAPLLRTRDLAVEALWTGAAPRASAQPGRVELLGGALRWSRLAWQGAGAGGGARLDAEAVLEPLRVAPLLAGWQPGFGWGGDLTLAGKVSVRSAPTVAADIVIERSTGDLTVTDELGTRTLGLTDLRLGLVVAGGTWSFTQGLAGRTLGVVAGAEVVRTSAQALWPPADAPLEGVLELRVDDLGTWGNWVPPGWRLGGALHTSASFGGRFGAPQYTGSVEGSRLSVRNFLQGVNVSDGDVAIQLQGSTARIERFTAKAGGGTLRLAGGAELGAAPRADLSVTAERFQLLGRVDRRIVASGSGRLQLDAKRLAFDGRFGVDEGLIDFTRSDAPTLSSDVVVVRAAGAPSPAAAASAAAAPTPAPALPGVARTPAREVALDLRVALGEKLRLKGRGLDTGLRGELQVTSPGGRLAVNGTVRATDGTYAAYGQKLVIDRGLITFTGAVENPRLDIEATRPNIDTRVGVVISGTPTNPRVRLFSEPELSEIDKLSWLVMGRASGGLGRTDTALLQRAALALLAGEGGGPTDQLTRALGLDDISVRQTESGEVRDTVIALGKQLSKRWYVGYERGLNATTGSFQLIYRIAQRFTLRAQSGDENSLDLIWTWRW